MKISLFAASLALTLPFGSTLLAQTPAAVSSPSGDQSSGAPAAAQASSPESDLRALITQVKAQIAAGKKTEADLAPQLAAFDALIAKYKDQKTEEAAMIPFMKGLLYLQVLNEPDKGKAILATVKTDYPGTRAAEAVDQVTAPQPKLLAAGVPAPDFKAVEVAGGPDSLTLSQYKGKIVVLDFWATWCGPCQHSMPHLERVYQAVKGQDVVVLGVCVSDTKDAYEKWLPEHKGSYNFTFAFDPAERDPVKSISAHLYGVSGIPTTYIIDKDGKVAASVVGFGGDSDTRIEKALGAVGVKVAATD